MNALISRQNTFFVVISFLILTFLSCSDDPSSPVEPKPKDTVTIGVDGGTVEKEDLTISIPAGTFDGDYDISVTEVEEHEDFGENAITNFYKIEGLPDNFSNPIKVQFKHNQQLSDNVFTAIGLSYFSETENDSSIIYKLNPAIDSSSNITGYIPIENYGYINKLLKTTLWAHPISYFVGPLMSYKNLTTENFKLELPFSISEKLNVIGEILENSYKITKDTLKLPFPLEVEHWEVTVKIQDEAVTGGFTPRSGLINISRDLIANNEFNKIKIALGRKFVELGLWNIIYQQQQLVSNDDHINQPGFLSLIASIQTWSEELFTTDPNFKYPEKFLQNYLAPFNGLRSGAGTNFIFPLNFGHGFGNSIIIKYLTEDNRFGKAGIIKTFQDIAAGQYPTTALMNNVDDLFVEWFPEFFKKYLNDELYDIPNNYFINDAHHEWTINNESDSLKLFAANDIGLYPDLSARIFKINVNYPAVDASQNLILSLKGPITEDGLALVVFGIQNNESVYLGTAYAQDFEIPNLKEYYDNNMSQFLVVLVNSLGGEPYLGESDIDLSIRVTPSKVKKLNYNRCKAVVQVVATIEEKFNDGSIEFTERVTDFGSSQLMGSFSEKTFTSYWAAGDTVIRTLSVNLNDTQDTVDYFIWYQESKHPNANTIETQEFSGKKIPINPNDESIFEINGQAVCNGNLELTYNYIWGDRYIKVPSFKCDENSYVLLQFYKD